MGLTAIQSRTDDGIAFVFHAWDVVLCEYSALSRVSVPGGSYGI